MTNAVERLRSFLNTRFVPGHPENHVEWLDTALAEERDDALMTAWERLREMGPRPIRLSVIQAVLMSGDKDAER